MTVKHCESWHPNQPTRSKRSKKWKLKPIYSLELTRLHLNHLDLKRLCWSWMLLLYKIFEILYVFRGHFKKMPSSKIILSKSYSWYSFILLQPTKPMQQQKRQIPVIIQYDHPIPQFTCYDKTMSCEQCLGDIQICTASQQEIKLDSFRKDSRRANLDWNNVIVMIIMTIHPSVKAVLNPMESCLWSPKNDLNFTTCSCSKDNLQLHTSHESVASVCASCIYTYLHESCL